jgi:purine-nucleoside phosphorylase
MTVSEELQDRLAGRKPRVLLTLGSGLGSLAEAVDEPLVLPYVDLGLPPATVPGHAGALLAGELAGVTVLVQQGRIHLYEGREPADVVACVRAAADVGVTTFVVTNAAGGLDPKLAPGDLMLITDHLNLTGATPLVGPRFVDLAEAYDTRLRSLAQDTAAMVGQTLVEGVYAGVRGPAYETPAEVTMLRRLGADAVGMSTVLEVIAAREAGMTVLGCSVITNVHRPGASTDHAEVLAAGQAAGARLADVIRALLPRLAT